MNRFNYYTTKVVITHYPCKRGTQNYSLGNKWCIAFNTLIKTDTSLM